MKPRLGMFGLIAAIVTLLLLFLAMRAQRAKPASPIPVIYGRVSGVPLSMYVFEPRKPNGIAVLRLVSGGWKSTPKNVNPGLAKLFTDRGETVFDIVHRTQPEYTIPEMVLDVQRAVRFVRYHAREYGVEPDRLGIVGASSGGNLSLIVAAKGTSGTKSAPDPVDRVSSSVEAVACFFPPSDFLNYGKPGVNVLTIDTLEALWPAFGVTYSTTSAMRDGIARLDSPIYAVTAKMPPTLIIHGDADQLVPLQQSVRLMAKLEALKVPHRLDIRPGKGHGWSDMGNDVPELAEWLEHNLGVSGSPGRAN